MSAAATPEHTAVAGKLNNVLATYQEAEDLINIGAYKNGSNKAIDYAIKKIDAVNAFLLQQTHDKFEYDDIIAQMTAIFDEE
jgi:flagellum-specific ATP synthase